MSQHPELSETSDGTVLAVHVQPGAGRTEVVGRHGDALKIRIAAPPTGNRANDAVIELVAREFALNKSDVQITSGASSRQKRVRLSGVDVKAATRVVDRLLAPTPGAARH
jgi:uncharacterized protein